MPAARKDTHLKKVMRVLIVDDHVLFREGLKNLIDSQPDFEVIAEAGSVREAIDQSQDLTPDLVLMDIGLPDGDGMEAVKKILSLQPDIKVVILTIHDSDDLLFTAIRLGAKGFLLKNTPIHDLLAALRGLERGEAALSRTMTRQVLDEFSRLGKTPAGSKPGLEALTPRELEVLEELATGATNKEIADRLVIAENTVKIHVHNILDKLDFSNRHDAARFARRHGIINESNDRDGDA